MNTVLLLARQRITLITLRFLSRYCYWDILLCDVHLGPESCRVVAVVLEGQEKDRLCFTPRQDSENFWQFAVLGEKFTPVRHLGLPDQGVFVLVSSSEPIPRVPLAGEASTARLAGHRLQPIAKPPQEPLDFPSWDVQRGMSSPSCYLHEKLSANLPTRWGDERIPIAMDGSDIR